MFTSEQADIVYATIQNQGYTSSPPTVCAGTTAPCPPNYIGINALVGIETGAGGVDYETDGAIYSTQNITGGFVDYDSDIEICLDPGFEASAAGTFNAFIDGCNGSGGVVNPLQNKQPTKK